MTGEPRLMVMLALLMISAGAMLAVAAGMWRAPRPLARWTGVIFAVSVAAYAVKLWNDETHLLGPIPLFIVLALSLGAVGWFWVFVLAAFEDRRSMPPALLGIAALSVILGLIAGYNPGQEFTPWLWLTSAFVRIGIAFHILTVVTRSWRGDLVEERRRLRGPFVLVVTLYILVITGFDIWEIFYQPVPMFSLVNSIILALICLSGAFVFIDARAALFASETAPRRLQRNDVLSAAGGARTNGNGLDRAAKADLDRLEMLMSTQQVWKEEGLTIAGLALRANVPESQLRRLINDCLGYRNFPSYVNAHRIAAAKSRLSDPNEARVSISTIAYDIGFASLGPFNRAFREETGVAPSEWRRSALNEPSPIPEKV
jgi:AraC-like DNA-binding protein